MSTVRYAFHGKRMRAGTAPAGEKVPRVARLLALAHRFQGMLDRGEVASMADLARLGRVSRARVTQVMDMLLLAPDIQEDVLLGRDERGLRDLMPLCRLAAWSEQRERRAVVHRAVA